MARPCCLAGRLERSWGKRLLVQAVVEMEAQHQAQHQTAVEASLLAQRAPQARGP